MEDPKIKKTMALNFNKYIFYHIPKTGGNYVRDYIKNSGIPTMELGHVHCTPLEIDHYQEYTSFTVVRHPLGWYESYYRYRQVRGWTDGHFIDKHCKIGTFEDFVASMLNAYPCGYVTARYLSVLPFVDYVLETENLTEMLNNLMLSFGFTRSINISKSNVTPKTIDTSISPELYDRLLRAEGRIIKYLKY